uniref:Protein kinase domain-containing protein n=1 Tax=Panagrolaimus sp. JU765 TaxID=591449 RepID=A0AC34QK65_9BILA
MPKYGLITRIGQGAQGVLIKARVIETGETVAIKRIVKLQDFFFDEDTASLVMEYVHSNLKLIIADTKRPQNDTLLHHYFSQLFSGVAYLHHINIMHRDIKPENILVTTNNKVKIGDFGLACLFVPNSKTKTYSHQVVTRWYRAPELLFGSITYDPKVDIWACGCILVEYLNGSPLFMGFNDIDQLVKVVSVLGTPKEETWPGWSSLPDANKILFENSSPTLDWSKIVPTASLIVKDLIQNLIQLNPSKRFSAIECVKKLEKLKPKVEILYKPPFSNGKHGDTKEITYNKDLDFDSTHFESREITQ